jgi:hypothetical protein
VLLRLNERLFFVNVTSLIHPQLRSKYYLATCVAITLEYKDLCLYILINGANTCCWLNGLAFDIQQDQGISYLPKTLPDRHCCPPSFSHWVPGFFLGSSGEDVTKEKKAILVRLLPLSAFVACCLEYFTIDKCQDYFYYTTITCKGLNFLVVFYIVTTFITDTCRI